MMLAVEVPAELFDEHPLGAVATAAGEALAGVLDCPAGAWLGVVLESIDVRTLSRWDLPAYLAAAQKQQAWAASLVDTAVAELATRPKDGNVAVDVEISHALRESLMVAQRRVHRAIRLRRFLPAFKAAFGRGELGELDVEMLVRATNGCDDPALLAKVQQRTLANRGTKTAQELRSYARKVLDRLDPAAATRRAKAAREQTDVTLHPGEDGMTGVVADLPVEDAMTVKAAVDAYAITAKHAGDDRRIGMLRGEALTRLCSDYLLGRSPLTAGTVPHAAGRPIEIGIVIGLRTALGVDDLPGEVPAAGIVPRHVIAQLVATELPRLRLMVIDDDPASPGYGRLVYQGVDSYRPTAQQVAHVRAAWVLSVGPGSQVRADRCDTEHAVEWPDGQTIVTNLAPWDRTWHNRKTRGSLKVTIDDSGTVTVTTVLGQTRTATPYDYSGHLQPAASNDEAVADDEPPPF